MNSFLSWELAGSLTREEEDFLTRTCGMDRLEEGVCDKVLGIDNSRHIMDGLLVKQALRCHPQGRRRRGPEQSACSLKGGPAMTGR